MCANDHPVTARDRLLQYFGVDRPDDVAPPELAFPLSLAPFIVRAEDREVMQRECRIGQFGLLPFWAKELAGRGIRVNTVAPGTTRTRISDDAFTKMPELIPAIAEGIVLTTSGYATFGGRAGNVLLAFSVDGK